MFIFLRSVCRHPATIGIFILLMVSVCLTSYTDIKSKFSGKADTLKLGPFVEPGFPFISTSVDARKLGPGFPEDNIAARTLALHLGNNAYACFDTDLLRWSVAWTGKFLPMVLMAQISYNDFFNKNNKVTTVPGRPTSATGSYAGWYAGKPGFAVPQNGKAGEPAWVPMPASEGRWKGAYVYGDKSVLNYSVKNSEVFELPGTEKFEDQIVFTRTLTISNATEELYLTVAEITNGVASEVKGQFGYIYQGAGKDTVTAVAVLGKRNADAKADVGNGRYLTVRFPASSKKVETAVAVWRGPAKQKAAFEKFCKKHRLSIPDFKSGGPSQWTETVTTTGKLSPDTAAFVTDILTLPLPNPWKRNVRIADVSFFKNGNAAVVTFEGDVWIVEGIDKNLGNIKWKRFASGLHEPMSVEVVNGTVHVFGREGIVRLHDLNHDGAADFYENFSNVMAQSVESREWAADMAYAPDGSFYIAKGGAQSNGPGVTPQVAKGFRTGSNQNGTILKVAPDGLSCEVIATGLRGPYIGLHPEKGILTATDQQGNFVPSTPIYLIKKGDYYGVEPTVHRDDNPPIAPPLTWIPHSVDRSSIAQAWVTGDKMGPLSGSLIHFSFGAPGLFKVLMDSSAAITQGGVSFIQANYPAPTSKGAVNPVDGQLYVTGFNLWGSSSTGISALLRLRFTGKPSYQPARFQAGNQGIMLGFDAELDARTVADAANFEVKRWNYKRTEEYGSGHFKLDGTTGEETMPVAASYLSADGKKVLLLVPGMSEVMQMEVGYKLSAKDGHKMNDHFWFTVNNMSDVDLVRQGFKNVDISLLSVRQNETQAGSVKEEPATALRGKELFQKMACAGCHSEGLRTKGMYGPPFQNLYGSERVFEDGSKAIADEKYIRESILTPSAKVVKGYNEEMPSFTGVLSDSDIGSIAMYIKSLKK